MHGNLNIYHFDVYRLSDSDEFYAIGGDEYFSNGICIIEWGELILDAIPNNYIQITFSRLDENSRVLKLKGTNDRLNNIIQEVLN